MQTFFPLGDMPEDFGDVVPVTITITKPRGSSTMFAKMQIIQSEPEGAVDTDNIVASDIYRGSGDFEFVTDPLGPGGEWNFEVAGRDGTNPDGNRGDALELSATIKAHPPDLEPDSDGERFTVEADSGVLTLAYTLPEFG